MSHLKYAQIVASGIEVIERVPIPDELIPPDANVEMDAKKASGYYAASVPDALVLKVPKGRGLGD
jgi:GTP cyclohydrolase II